MRFLFPEADDSALSRDEAADAVPCAAEPGPQERTTPEPQPDSPPAARPIAALAAARQEAAADFARDLLACDLNLLRDYGGRVRRLIADCRILLRQQKKPADAFKGKDPLGWVRLELFCDKPDVLRCLMRHRRGLEWPVPHPSRLVEDFFRPASMEHFESLYKALPGYRQRALLGRADLREQALQGTERQGSWYSRACEKREIPHDSALLWQHCCHPVTTDRVDRPCFALLPVEDQLARAARWLNSIKSRLVDTGLTVIPLPEARAASGAERRALALCQRLAQEQPKRLWRWLQQRDPVSQGLVLLIYGRHNSVQSLDALGHLLTRALHKGMKPELRPLALPDNTGQFLAHYLFRAPGPVAMELLTPCCRLHQLSVAAEGSGPGAGRHPLHGQHLYALELSGGRKAFCFHQDHAVPDTRAALRLMLGFVGESGLLELALGAANRGTPGWWAWLVQALQLCPGLVARLASDPRTGHICVGCWPQAGLPVPAMLENFWTPFAPLGTARQQHRCLEAIVRQAASDHGGNVRWMWSLLEACLILCQPPACRWLLRQVLTASGPWQVLRDRFFDGHSTRFNDLRHLLIASWCRAGASTRARRFDDWITERQGVPVSPASPLSPSSPSAARSLAACLTAALHPALFSRTAGGSYGRSVWFRTDQGVVRLKLQKKGELLVDLLREQWALEFLAGDSRRLALQGVRPEPLGCGRLPDFAGWLASSGLDLASQQALADAVQLTVDGAVWGLVLRTPDEGYHHYVHQPDVRGNPQAALGGLELAARDAGVLLREGLVPTNLLPLYHRLPECSDADKAGGSPWQFLHGNEQGVISDWDGKATDYGNVARAPYGLRDWADVRSLDSMTLDSVLGCPEQRWHSGAVRVNEAGKILTGLVLLAARLLSGDFDGTQPAVVDAQRERMARVLHQLFTAFLEGLAQEPQVVALWQQQVQKAGLLEAAARQIVFWCETGEAPAFEQHLRAGTLPCDIPRHYEPILSQGRSIQASSHSRHSLMDHENGYPLRQLTALIYLTLAHAIACTDSLDRPSGTGYGLR